MSAQLFYLPFNPVFNSNGLPAGAASASFYYTGTTSPAPIYADVGLMQRIYNPVQTDALGNLPTIYMDSTITYRVRVVDYLGAQLGDDIDPYIPGTARLGPPGPAGENILDDAWTEQGTLTAGSSTIATTHAIFGTLVTLILGGSEIAPSEFTITNPNLITLNKAVTVDTTYVVKAFDTPTGGFGMDNALYTAAGAGAVQRSAQDAWREMSVSVMSYVPLALQAGITAGTDTSDHYPYFMAAKAAAGHRPVFIPAGSWNTSQEIDYGGLRVFGDGEQVTYISATAPMRSVMRINGQTIWARDFSIYCAPNATTNYAMYGIFPDGINGSQIDRVSIDNASVAGIAFLEGNSNNTATSIDNALIRHSGRRVPCGTTTAAQYATTITVSGANPTNLPALGYGSIRSYDFVKIGNMPAREIQSFDGTTITFYPGLENAAPAGTAVTIVQGSNIEIQRNGNSSKLKINNCELQFGALAAIDDCALYGHDDVGCTAEINGYSVVVGRRVGGGESQPININSRDIYTEQNNEGAAYYLGSFRELNVVNPMADTQPDNGLAMFRFADFATARTGQIMVEGVTYTRRTEQDNVSSINVYAGSNVEIRQEASGGQNFTVNLTAPPGFSNARTMLPYFTASTQIFFSDLNGKTCTFQTTDGTLINGQSASIQWVGQNQLITAVFTSNGWRLYGLNNASYKMLNRNVGGSTVAAGGTTYSDFAGIDFTKAILAIDAFGNGENSADPTLVAWKVLIRTATQLRVQATNNATAAQTVNIGVRA